MVSPTVFWADPTGVYSGLVRIDRYETSSWPTESAFRDKVFSLIDIAFSQRRKTSRNAFAEWAGSGNESAERLLSASIDPSRRGETLWHRGLRPPAAALRSGRHGNAAASESDPYLLIGNFGRKPRT